MLPVKILKLYITKLRGIVDLELDFNGQNAVIVGPNGVGKSAVVDAIDFFNIESKKYDFNSFEIKLCGNKANLEIFKLEELYKQHKDIVLELLIKKAYYPKSYIEELKKFDFTEDEIYRYLLCNYKKNEDLHKRPLSKLIKDISEELGIL